MRRDVILNGEVEFLPLRSWPYADEVNDLLLVKLPITNEIKPLDRSKVNEYIRSGVDMKIPAVKLLDENIFPKTLFYKELGFICVGTLSDTKFNGKSMEGENSTLVLYGGKQYPFLPDEYDKYIFIAGTMPALIIDGLRIGSITEGTRVEVPGYVNRFNDEMRQFDYMISMEMYHKPPHGIRIKDKIFIDAEITRKETKELVSDMFSKLSHKDLSDIINGDYDKIVKKFFG